MKKNSQNIFLFLLFSLLLFPDCLYGKKNHKQFTVVIDAGHGGKDIGAVDNGAKEKNINLGVALQLEKLLEKKLKDVKVVMTRKDDRYLTLQQRADIANKSKGNLFISIHTNSVDKSNKNRKTISGASVYALGLHKDENNMRVARRENSVIELESNYNQKYSGFDPNKDESYIIFEMAQKKNLSKSIRFAEMAQKELVDAGRKDRGVHQAGFWVLWATSMPSVLIELDFICNPKTAKYLASSQGEKELAGAIFNALKRYYDSWEAGEKKHLSESLPEIEEPGESVAGGDVTYVAKIPSAVKRRKGVAPSKSGSQQSEYTVAKRRRRNEASRVASDNRNLETSSIPLHSEREREASYIAFTSESTESIQETNALSDEGVDKKSKKKKKKDKKKKEKKGRKSNAHNAKTDKFVKVYKIQILASADRLKQNNPRFCGLSPISTYEEKNLYYYGESTDKREIETMLKDVKKKIPDAFIISLMKSEKTAKK